MARMNWERNQFNKQRNELLQELPKGGSQRGLFKQMGIWHLAGRYHGTAVTDLPSRYLFWVVENFTAGDYKEIAEGEIYRRYNSNNDKYN